MPTSVGPNLSSESSLVYAFDTGDTVNSYLGPPSTNIVSSPFNIAGLGSAATVTKTNNTNINYDGQLTAATISGSGWMAYTSGGTVSGSRYVTTWLVKYANTPTVTFDWGGAHTGTITSLTLNLLTGQLTLNGTTDPSPYYGVSSLPNGWYRVYYAANAGTTYYPQVSLTGVFYIGGIQVESGSIATPFLVGTRSVSGSLLDIGGNRLTINSISASYNSSAQLTFNGSSYLFGTATNRLITHTVEAVFRPTSHPGYGASVVSDQYSTVVNYKLGYESTGLMAGGFYDGTWRLTPNITTTLNTWHHVVYTYDGSSLTIYKNGLLGGTNLYTGSPNTNGLSLRIGRRWDNPDYFVGDISIVRIYNRALTADEITNNFNELKSRFNFS